MLYHFWIEEGTLELQMSKLQCVHAVLSIKAKQSSCDATDS